MPGASWARSIAHTRPRAPMRDGQVPEFGSAAAGAFWPAWSGRPPWPRPGVQDARVTERTADHYDRTAHQETADAFYGNSGFRSFGYWTATTRSPRQACDAPGCTFRGMNATSLEFADSTFDATVSVEAAFHVDTRADFLAEEHRIPRPGGGLALSDILLAPTTRLQPTANQVDSLAEHEEICRRAGFAEVEVIDATERTWQPFARHLVGSTRSAWRRGLVSGHALARVLRWVRNADDLIEAYLLVACRKDRST
jgi:SAM-dependent methyltransferase